MSSRVQIMKIELDDNVNASRPDRKLSLEPHSLIVNTLTTKLNRQPQHIYKIIVISIRKRYIQQNLK